MDTAFIRKWAAFLSCCTVLTLSAGCAAPETEDTGRNTQESAKENVKTTESGNAAPVKKELSKEDISSWINMELTGSESETTAEDIKKWENTNQGGFFKSWRKTVLKQIKGWENAEDYEKTAEIITKACDICKKICGSGKEVETLQQDAETVSILAKDNEKLKNKYGFDILSERDACSFNTYYIPQHSCKQNKKKHSQANAHVL